MQSITSLSVLMCDVAKGILVQGDQQKPSLFTMQDGYRSNAYLNISVRDNARITCEALKNMPPQELTKLWKVRRF